MNNKKPALSEVDYLKPFIESTIAAAGRFRRVLIVLIIASVLAFGAFWNHRQGSWLNSRVSTARAAERFFNAQDALLQNEKRYQALNEQIANIASEKVEERKKLEEERSKLETQLRADRESIKNTSSDVQQWINLNKFQSKSELGPVIQRLEAARVDHILLIRIPFFGVVLDVNDLGLLGGFTFVVILMWFRFSLWREYYNLRSTFKEAEEQHLEFCYKSLAMQQVLTVPPDLPKTQSEQKPWGKVVRLLYFLPVTVQAIILGYDGYTFKYGWYISEFNTVLGIAVSLTFLVLSGFLTYWCLQLSRDIDSEWNNVAQRIRSKNGNKAFSGHGTI